MLMTRVESLSDFFGRRNTTRTKRPSLFFFNEMIFLKLDFKLNRGFFSIMTILKFVCFLFGVVWVDGGVTSPRFLTLLHGRTWDSYVFRCL